MGAMQAQDYAQAVWGVGSRTQSATLQVVESAIAQGRILRTWPMRGTIHFVSGEDARWMLRLMAPRSLAGERGRRAQLEIDDETLGRSGDLLGRALAGGTKLSRPAVMQLLEGAGIRTGGQRGYHILWHHAQAGLICIGPMAARQQTFVLLNEWAPHSRDLSRDESLAEVARRYFTSHGPATLRDFAGWTGLTLADARRGLEAVEPELTALVANDVEYWLASDIAGAATPAGNGIYLLPGFDEYLLGYKDRSAVLSAHHAGLVAPGGNGLFFPILVAGGRIVGTWKRVLKKSAVDITVSPFEEPVTDSELLAAAARRFSDFLGLPLTLTTQLRG
jgi:hypothetical protein